MYPSNTFLLLQELIRGVHHFEGGSLETARWRHCGRPKAAAFSTSARWSAVGTYSAGISRFVSLNSGTRAREAGNANRREDERDEEDAVARRGKPSLLPGADADPSEEEKEGEMNPHGRCAEA